MIKLTGIGHVLLRVADQEASKRFYRDVLGFRIAEEEPEHGGVFITSGESFHTLDIGQPPTRKCSTLTAEPNRARSHCLSGREPYDTARGPCSPPRKLPGTTSGRHAAGSIDEGLTAQDVQSMIERRTE